MPDCDIERKHCNMIYIATLFQVDGELQHSTRFSVTLQRSLNITTFIKVHITL
jgi:hypothetical protein